MLGVSDTHTHTHTHTHKHTHTCTNNHGAAYRADIHHGQGVCTHIACAQSHIGFLFPSPKSYLLKAESRGYSTTYKFPDIFCDFLKGTL